VLALGTACFHAKEVADPSQEERATQQGSEEEKSAKEEAGTDGTDDKDSEKADAPSEKKAAARPEPSTKRAASDKKGDGEQGEDGIDPEDIPVASSPQGLLKPGADEKVREKLGVPKEGGMRKALMNFQREHDLPATGMLDHETVEKLGLDPKDIFQKEG
jgi:putative peptidoglycan binding protein